MFDLELRTSNAELLRMHLDYNHDQQLLSQSAFAPKRKLGMLKRLYGLLTNPAYASAHLWLFAPQRDEPMLRPN